MTILSVNKTREFDGRFAPVFCLWARTAPIFLWPNLPIMAIGKINCCLQMKERKRNVIPSERQRVEESTHFVDISCKIGAKISRLRFAPLEMTTFFDCRYCDKQSFILPLETKERRRWPAFSFFGIWLFRVGSTKQIVYTYIIEVCQSMQRIDRDV